MSETPPLLKKALSYTPEICFKLADAPPHLSQPFR
jgi:hypothetical protein